METRKLTASYWDKLPPARSGQDLTDKARKVLQHHFPDMVFAYVDEGEVPEWETVGYICLQPQHWPEYETEFNDNLPARTGLTVKNGFFRHQGDVVMVRGHKYDEEARTYEDHRRNDDYEKRVRGGTSRSGDGLVMATEELETTHQRVELPKRGPGRPRKVV